MSDDERNVSLPEPQRGPESGIIPRHESSPMRSLGVPAPQLRAAPHHRDAAPKQAFNAQFVLFALARWWKVAGPVGVLLACGAAAIVHITFKPQYESVAWLRIYERKPVMAFVERDQDSRLFVENQIAYMKSELVMAPLLSQPQIARIPEIAASSDPTSYLAKQVSVSSMGRSELFTIKYQSTSPENAQKVVNAVATQYFEMHNKRDKANSESVIKKLDEELKRRKPDIEQLRKQLRFLTKEAAGKDPYAATKTPSAIAAHPLAEIQAQMTEVEVQQELLKAEIAALEEAVDPVGGASDAAIDVRVNQNAAVQELNGILFSMRETLKGIEKASTKGQEDPKYKEQLEKIESQEAALASLRDALREPARAELEASAANAFNERLAAMKSELAQLTLRWGILDRRYKTLLQDAELFSDETIQLEFARADLDRAESVYYLIAERMVKLQTEQGARPRVEWEQEAGLPRAPVNSATKKMMMVALPAFLFPFALAVLWELLVRRVSDRHQLEEQSNLPVVGEVATLPVRSFSARGLMNRASGRGAHMFEESVDGLRTCLILSEEMRDKKVIVIASATSQEGKTSIAAQMAVSIARATNELTLLVDGDMRSPDLHNVFDVPLEPGLSDVLERKSPLDDAIVTSWSNRMHVLPAGKLRVSPHKLLGNGVLENLLAELKLRYRYIIIDTPPVLAAAESLVLARAADATLLCAKRDFSRMEQVKAACQRLIASGARPVGTVLNGVPPRAYAYHYGSYEYSRD